MDDDALDQLADALAERLVARVTEQVIAQLRHGIELVQTVVVWLESEKSEKSSKTA